MSENQASAISAPRMFELRSLQDAHWLAQEMAKSGLVPETIRKPADLFYILITGHELGFSPAMALRAFSVVKGRVVIEAKAKVALAKNHADCLYFEMVESTGQRATYKTKRRGETQETRITFTIAQAQGAGLTGKDNWRNYPDAMLRARASSALVDAVYPDACLGIMSKEEAEDLPDALPTLERIETKPPTPTTRQVVQREVKQSAEVEREAIQREPDGAKVQVSLNEAVDATPMPEYDKREEPPPPSEPPPGFEVIEREDKGQVLEQVDPLTAEVNALEQAMSAAKTRAEIKKLTSRILALPQDEQTRLKDIYTKTAKGLAQ